MRIFRWYPLWLILILIIGTTVGQNCWRYYRLTQRGMRIQGFAGERRPHGQIAYSFKLDGKIYRGVGFPEGSVVSDRDPLTVVYLPDDPATNCLGNPGMQYSNELPLVLIVSFLFPTLIVAVVAYRLAGRTRLTEQRQANT